MNCPDMCGRAGVVGGRKLTPDALTYPVCRLRQSDFTAPQNVHVDFSDIAQRLSSSPVTAFPLLFLAGMLTSLTPCVYPMIPITAAIVGGATTSDQTARRGRVLTLTLAYVFGLALAYATLGL